MAHSGEPAHFGRNAVIVQRSRFGRASIIVAFCALGLVLAGTGVAWISAQLGPWQQFASILLLGLCFGFAPLVHVAGIVVGLIGLLRTGDNKGLATIGVLLNIAFIAFAGVSGYMLSSLAMRVM